MGSTKLRALDGPALADWLSARNCPPFRAKQIRDAIVRARAADFDGMTNLPKELRAQLEADFVVFSSRVLRDNVADDGTTKLLLQLEDGQSIECVLIPERDRRTVCLSTQVGCGMGCVFCASGINGVVRNLSTDEMIEELLQLQRRLPNQERLTHIVVMGMGEPLANLDALLLALDFATSPEGLGISARHVTISTVGLPAKIRRLAEIDKPYHLAVSLHAPNDMLRRKIVPTAEKVAIAEILEAADNYRQASGRQLTFEYVLLGGINDSQAHARQLVQLLRPRDAMINLIPYNPVPGLNYQSPKPGHPLAFAEVLRNAGFTVKIRKRKGSAINAACGQLRRENQPAGLPLADNSVNPLMLVDPISLPAKEA